MEHRESLGSDTEELAILLALISLASWVVST